MSRPVTRAGLWGLSLLLAGCGGGLDRQEVPSDPIAYLRQDARGLSGVDQFIDGLTLLGRKQSGWARGFRFRSRCSSFRPASRAGSSRRNRVPIRWIGAMTACGF